MSKEKPSQSSIRIPDHNKTSRATMGVYHYILASFAMMMPQLICLVQFESSLWTGLLSLIGSCCEGAMILMVAAKLFASFSKNSGMRRGILVLPMILFYLFIFLIQVADFHFQQKTHGDKPSMWVIVSALSDWMMYVKSSLKDDFESSIAGIAFLVLSHTIAFLIVWKWNEASQTNNDTRSNKNKQNVLPQHYKVDEKLSKHPAKTWRNIPTPPLTQWMILLVFLSISVGVYVCGAWMPVTHTFVSVVANRFMQHVGGKFVLEPVDDGAFVPTGKKKSPNVVFIVHESLSGHLLLNTEEGLESTPFLNSLVKDNTGEHDGAGNQSDTYLFRHARPVAGNSELAIPSLFSGHYPFEQFADGTPKAYSEALTGVAKKAGYKTGMFSCTKTDWTGTIYETMMYFLKGYYDDIVEPATTGDPIVNEYGQDDRKLVPHFERWLHQHQNDDADDDAPFWSSFYLSGSHHPFLRYDEANDPSEIDLPRYYSSLRVMDGVLEDVFRVLRETGKLDNTVVVGLGDHGEDPQLLHARTTTGNARILSVGMYMHIPKTAFDSKEQQDNLKHNMNQVVTSLDVAPTLKSLLNIRPSTNAPTCLDSNCLSGRDLTSAKMPSDRVVASYHSGETTLGWKVATLMTKDQGLVYRQKGKEESLHRFPFFNPGNEEHVLAANKDQSSTTPVKTFAERKFWLDLFDRVASGNDGLDNGRSALLRDRVPDMRSMISDQEVSKDVLGDLIWSASSPQWKTESSVDTKLSDEASKREDSAFAKNRSNMHTSISLRNSRVWATLVSDDSIMYTDMAEIQITSVNQFSNFEHITMVLPQVSKETKDRLALLPTTVVEVPPIRPPVVDEEESPRWADVFAKLNSWNLIEYNQVAFIDADAFLQSRDADRVFELCASVEFCGVEDVTSMEDPTDLNRNGVQSINAGMMVLTPSTEIYDFLLHVALPQANKYFLPEQGFLADVFIYSLYGDTGKTMSLPWYFNTCSHEFYAKRWECDAKSTFQDEYIDCFMEADNQIAIHHMCDLEKSLLYEGLCVFNPDEPECKTSLLKNLQFFQSKVNPCSIGNDDAGFCETVYGGMCGWEGPVARCVEKNRAIVVTDKDVVMLERMGLMDPFHLEWDETELVEHFTRMVRYTPLQQLSTFLGGATPNVLLHHGSKSGARQEENDPSSPSRKLKPAPWLTESVHTDMFISDDPQKASSAVRAEIFSLLTVSAGPYRNQPNRRRARRRFLKTFKEQTGALKPNHAQMRRQLVKIYRDQTSNTGNTHERILSREEEEVWVDNAITLLYGKPLPSTKRQNHKSGNLDWANTIATPLRRMRGLFRKRAGLGKLLKGVDTYVIEGPSRVGYVTNQAKENGINTIQTLSSFTPAQNGDEIDAVSTKCRKTGTNVTPWSTKTIAISLSHVKALQVACAKGDDRQSIALVLEDDVSLEPMQWWPESLIEMLGTLPEDWTVVNAAVVNTNDPLGFHNPVYLRPLENSDDWGTAAVAYNLANPNVCASVVHKTNVEVLLNSDHTCEAADYMLYEELGRNQFAYSVKMPLFYFSLEEEKALPGFTNNHSVEWAERQRDAWMSFLDGTPY